MVLARTVTKLLDEAIVPAVFIIAGKVFGLVLANILNSLPYTIQTSGSILPWTVIYNSTTEANAANTFSNFVMYLVVLAGFSFVLFRAHFLHDTHITPHLSRRLVRMRLENLIQDSFEIYHQALVWLSFLWLTTVIVFTYTLSGGSIILGMIAFLLSFAATYVYTKDIEIELETERLISERH